MGTFDILQHAKGGEIMICLLCPSPAVADCLCVPCGAKLWAARLWNEDPHAAAECLRTPPPAKTKWGTIFTEHTMALADMVNGERAAVFLTRLESAKAERAAKGGSR